MIWWVLAWVLVASSIVVAFRLGWSLGFNDGFEARKVISMHIEGFYGGGKPKGITGVIEPPKEGQS